MPLAIDDIPPRQKPLKPIIIGSLLNTTMIFLQGLIVMSLVLSCKAILKILVQV